MSEITKQSDDQPGVIPSQAGPENQIPKTIQKIFSNPIKIMAGISSVLLVMIMLLVTTDVAGRYLFKHPINGSDEMVGLLLLCAAACAFCYTQKERRHVRILLLIERLPIKLRLLFDVFDSFLGLTILSLISWQVFLAAEKLFFNLQGGSQMSETLKLPWLPFMFILGLGFVMFSLILLGDLIINVVKVARK